MRAIVFATLYLVANVGVQADPKTVKLVARYHVQGKTQIPPEARLTVTAYDGDDPCGFSPLATPPDFSVNFPIYVDPQTKHIRVETTLLGADDYAPREPSFPFPVKSPKTDLGTHFIVTKPTAFLVNADKAEKADSSTSTLSPAKLDKALHEADAAVALANTPETELRSKRVKAALQVKASSDPQETIKAVDTLRTVELPSDEKVALSLLQQRFDTYESAIKAFNVSPDEHGLISGALDGAVADESARTKLKTELATLTNASRKFWPHENVSFDDKLAEYATQLGSQLLAQENIVRVTLERGGMFDLKAENSSRKKKSSGRHG